jgi:hypothetical protein
VGAELVVEVPHVRPDWVHRHVELAGDLRRGKAGLQEAQDARLGLAERLGQALGRPASDLDLLLRCPVRPARASLDALASLFAAQEARVDGQVETPGGMA